MCNVLTLMQRGGSTEAKGTGANEPGADGPVDRTAAVASEREGEGEGEEGVRGEEGSKGE